MGKNQYMQFRETDAPQPEFDGHHVQMYIADFSGPYEKLKARNLISVEDNQYQYRFKDIVDLDSGKVLFVGRARGAQRTHPMYLRPLVNRNPATTNQNYANGYDSVALGDGSGRNTTPGHAAAELATRSDYCKTALKPEKRRKR